MFPTQFLQLMEQMLGPEYQAFVTKLEENQYQALRLNPLKGSTEAMLEKLPFSLTQQVPWEKNGFYYESKDKPGKSPYHEAGCYYIQEPSAMAPVHFLNPEPGETVLDLCASPGGKSTQIASAMQGQGFLVANEIHPARAKILSENMERMGVTNCVVTNASPDALSVFFPNRFDKILVDAPCSGEGMFRKNEGACGEWSLDHVIMCGNRQDTILEEAVKMLVPGGTIVYSTCTFAPWEDEGTVSRFLMHHPDFALDHVTLLGGMTQGNPKWGDFHQPQLKETVRLMPHHVNGEGHFLAVLHQIVKDPEVNHPQLNSVSKSLSKKKARNQPSLSLDPFWTFVKETMTPLYEQELREYAPERFLLFGEQLYLTPVTLQNITGLKVLRPGLHLGTLRKNRFEPSHAWALSCNRGQVQQSNSYGPQSDEISRFLKGETFQEKGKKGYHLICVDGYSLGWGKLSGDVMKNHYPKGLRKYNL